MQFLLFGVVEWQIAVIEQLVDVICHFVVIQVSVFHDNTLAHKVTLKVRTTGDDNLLEPVLEFDVPFVALELDDLEVADAVAGEMGSEWGTVALEAEHDGVPLVVEECAHGLTQVAHGFVEENEIELVAFAFVVLRVQLVLHFLLETVVEFVSVVRILPRVIELLKHIDRLCLQLCLALPFNHGLLVVWGRESQFLLL